MVDPTEHTVAALEDAIEDIEDADALRELLERERDGDDRETAIAAIEARLSALGAQDGDDDGDAEEEAAGDDGTDLEATVAQFETRLDGIESDLDAAETEADLDDVDAAIDDLEDEIEGVDWPEPPEDDDDEAEFEDLREPLDDAIDDLRSGVEDRRGPYASDVIDDVGDVEDEIADTRWTADGVDALEEAVAAFLADAGAAIDRELEPPVRPSTTGEESVVDDGAGASGEGATQDEDAAEHTSAIASALAGGLSEAQEAIEDAGLDPDEDEETIATLLDVAEELGDAVDDAERWSDLEVREQLRRDGFYDVLDHIVDFPPELHAIKVHEQRGNVEQILLAFESFDSDFVEEACLDALERMGPEEALEPMNDLARKRNKKAISILGKIGSEEPVDTVVGYVDQDSDPLLQRTTLRALGEIGATAAVEPIAQQLLAEDESVRSAAARSLGLIGDTRAVEPLADVLADDESDNVRASAAWALNAIGTERALEIVSDYEDDRASLVQAEARRAV